MLLKPQKGRNVEEKHLGYFFVNTVKLNTLSIVCNQSVNDSFCCILVSHLAFCFCFSFFFLKEEAV